nr:helix-turn-helix domain-containing protein [Fodinicola feengrottensis]
MTTDTPRPPIDLELCAVLAALADPVRLLVVQTLLPLGSSPCNDLHHAAGLTISRSTFSHHQKILREAGVIHERINGARRILSVRTEDLQAPRFPGLLDLVLADAPKVAAAPTTSRFHPTKVDPGRVRTFLPRR